MDFRMLIVGEDYPGEVPVAEQGGGLLEVKEDGSLWLVIQMPNPSPEETAALREGFSSYSLYISPKPPHVAIMVWKFPAPVGFLETPFHASVYEDDRIKTLLKQPIENNLLTTVVLDDKKIAQLRASGLVHDAIGALHSMAANQLHFPVTREEYAAALQNEYRLTSKDMFGRGKQFRHRSEP